MCFNKTKRQLEAVLEENRDLKVSVKALQCEVSEKDERIAELEKEVEKLKKAKTTAPKAETPVAAKPATKKAATKKSA